MHRYVVAVTRDIERAKPLLSRLAARLGDWDQPLASDLVSAWVIRRPPSALGARSLGATGAIIGLDFDAPSPWGAFVRIGADYGRRRVSVFRDPTGRLEAWLMAAEGLDLIFSHYEDVSGLRARPSKIDWDFLAFHLANSSARGRSTGLEDVSEVAAGETLIWSPHGLERRMTWRPHQIAAEPFSTRIEARTAIRAAAEQGVAAWAGRYGRIGLDLSGGLDSAIVLGLLRRSAGHPDVVGINWVIPHAEGDERSFARDAAALHGVRLVEAPVPIVQDLWTPSLPRQLMRPAIRIMPLGYDPLGVAIARAENLEASFTGTGGDHLFCEYLPPESLADYLRRHPWPVDALSIAHDLALASQETIWAVLARGMAGRFRGPPGLGTLLACRNPFLAQAVGDRPDYERYAHPWITEALGRSSPGKLDQVRHLVDLQHHYWRYGRADAAEEVHPLVSQPLMEACLRTPAYWFCPQGVRRGLARQVFADLLPDSIRTRRTKGSTSSHWVGLLRAHLPALRTLLLEGELARRGLLDRAALEATLTPMAISTGKDFVPLATCLTTEMWVQAYQGSGALAAPAAA